jgi:hypothetical protein
MRRAQIVTYARRIHAPTLGCIGRAADELLYESAVSDRTVIPSDRPRKFNCRSGRLDRSS